MIHEVEAIYDHGALRPLTPLSLAEGTRVHLRVELSNGTKQIPIESRELGIARLSSPRLSHPEQAADFTMEVTEAIDARL